MNILYLAIQHTYTEVQLGLYKNNHCLGSIALHKHQASSLLVEAISTLLTQHSTKLTQLSFLAVNQGPGPFTTLRVVIATVNGLSFSLGIPLVGIDGIQTLINEYHNTEKSTVIALLNAFNQDVYFAIKPTNAPISIGSQNSSLLLEYVKKITDPHTPITFLGNGAILYADKIKAQIPHATIDDTLMHCSLDALAQSGFKQWQNKEHTSRQLQPIYLKNTVYNNLDISKK